MTAALPPQWDLDIDVLVVGFGFAGGATAIAAHDAGLEALIIEKLPHPGGVSIASGGGIGMATDADAAFQCLRAACAGRTPDDVLRALADELVQLPDWIRSLAARSDTAFEVEEVRGDAGYDLPGREAFGWILVRGMGEFEGFPWAKGLRGGARLFRILLDNVEDRGIPVWCEAPATELITDANGEVLGAWVVRDGRQLAVRARRGVVLACGGFEWAEDLKRQYFEGMPVFGVVGRGNTGDGIRMAQSVGADLWHMWHFHGSYGFKPAGLSNPIRHTFAGPRGTTVMPWIVVDRDGRRFMSEIHPSPNDTNARPMTGFDPDRLEYPRIPSYAIFDDHGRQLGPLGFPIRTSEADDDVEWSADNLAEVDKGWILQADTLGDLAGLINADGHGAHVDAAVLETTVAEWNRCVDAGHDPLFQRPATTMLRVATPPFHAIAVWPIVSNTQGGPVHDPHRRVLDPFGRPIPRLYTAGELGSVFGHLYLLAGNIGECFTSARQAVRHLTAMSPSDAPAAVTPAEPTNPTWASAHAEPQGDKTCDSSVPSA